MEFPSGVNCKAEYALDCPMCAGIASKEALKYIGDTFDRTRHTGNDARHCSKLRIHHYFSPLERKSVPGCIQIQILPFRNVCITARLHLTPQNLQSIAATTPRASADLPGVPESPRVATSAPMYRRYFRATAPARWNHRQIALGTKGFQLSALSASALGTLLFGPHSPLL